MQSDEFAIDHLNGRRISYNSTDMENTTATLHIHVKHDEMSDESESQRHRRHKRIKKKKKHSLNEDVIKYDKSAEQITRETINTEGESPTVSRDYTDGEVCEDEDEVPHWRLKIGNNVENGLGERRRSSHRWKPQSAKTKLPKLPIPADQSPWQIENERTKLAVDEEDISHIFQGDVSRGYDSVSESRIPQSKDSDSLLKKDKGVGFPELDKKDLNDQQDSETKYMYCDAEVFRLDFVWKMHIRFRSLGILTHGLVAGLALSQCLFIFTFSNKTLRDDYSQLALLFQAMYYVLLSISIVSVLDRFFDVGSDWGEFLKYLLAKPLRVIILISYLLALMFSVSLAQLDDSISAKKITPKKLDTWKVLNMFRVVTSIIGWILVAFSSMDDETALRINKMKATEHEGVNTISKCDMDSPLNVLSVQE